MNVARYRGWRRQGESSVFFVDSDGTTELVALTCYDGFTGRYRVGWGSRCPEAINLARILLWHATWDRGIVADLTELFHDQVTSCLPQRWTLNRESVRDWIQKQQPTREMMNGQDPMAPCPGSF